MGKLKISELALAGACIVEPSPFVDSRGVFARFYCKEELKNVTGSREIVNMNFSRTSQAGAVRGMHFQNSPMAEMKMVRCIRGSIYDVIVDIRKDSPTFLEWVGVELTAENMRMIIVPEGFAHGFQTLEAESEITYLTTEYYSPEFEDALNVEDPSVGIEWPLAITELSERDKKHPFISDRNFTGISIQDTEK